MGRAPQRTDITSGDKPIPIFGIVLEDVHKNPGDQQDSKAE